jgi:hypothetical protein
MKRSILTVLGEEDEDFIDTGASILNFYCTLVDLVSIL